MKIGLLIDLDVDNIFRKYLALLGGLGSKMRPFLIYQGTTIRKQL